MKEPEGFGKEDFLKRTAWIPGQLSLWELECLMKEAETRAAGKLPFGGKPEGGEGTADADYLYKGERLRSLAREHFEKRGLLLTDLERKLYGLSIEPKATAMARDAAMLKLRGFVGNLLKGIKEEGDDHAKAILRLTDGRVSVKPRPDLRSLKSYLRGAADDVVIEVRVNEDSRNGLSFFSLKTKALDARKKRITIYDGKWLVQDARTAIAYCIMYAEAEKACRDEAFHRDAKRTDDERKCQNGKNALRLAACYEIARSCASALPRGRINRREFTQMVNERIGENDHISVLLPSNACLDKAEIDLLSQAGIDVIVSEKSAAELKKEFADAAMLTDSSKCITPAFLFAEDDGFVKDGARVLWRDLLALGGFPNFGDCFFKRSRFGNGRGAFEARHFAHATRYGQNAFDDWLFEAFFAVFEKRKAEVLRIREYEDAERGHAKSYENKARLPEKTIRAMKESPLNECFGFVEYDEDVDLEKAAVFERTFLDVRRKYLSGFDASNNAIRLRRLGNHKATGLYYPGVRCLCVDYRHPESFLHEFGHLMDYEGGDLSLSADFLEIRDEYGKWIDAHADKITTRGKYDKAYYLTPTEVFARSFELYCKKVLGLTCCLLPESFREAVYPQAAHYEELVTAYFDRLLNRQEEGGDLRESA